MKNRIYDAFHDIKAEDKLKQDTLAFLGEQINKENKFHVKRFAIALASIFIILIAGGLSYNFYFSASAYVDIDVNPSIELTLNRVNRIIDVYAYNNDGEEILSAVNLKHKSYNEAINILIDEMEKRGYIVDDGLFSATLQTKNDENESLLLDSVKTSIDSSLQSHHSSLEQDIFVIDSETKTLAHELNLSPARYLAILDLQIVDSTATFESCKDHTISEIKQQTHDHMNEDETEENHKSDGDNSSEHNHDNTTNHSDTENDTSHKQNEETPNVEGLAIPNSDDSHGETDNSDNGHHD